MLQAATIIQNDQRSLEATALLIHCLKQAQKELAPITGEQTDTYGSQT